MDWRTWSPFQSKKVREICEHMTEAEKDEVARQGAIYGIWVFISFALPVALVVVSWVGSKLGVMALFPFLIHLRPAVYVLLFAIPIHIAGAVYFRKRQKRFLASTEWVRSQGYNADEL